MKRTILFLSISLLLPAACKEAQMHEYENRPGLYFYRQPGTTAAAAYLQRDSLSFTFYSKGMATGEEYVHEFDLRTIGMPEDRERTFRIVQSNAGEPGAAVAGKHYVAFDDPRMAPCLIVAPNAISHTLPVIFINDESLGKNPVRLKIEIADNGTFSPGIEAQSSFVVNYSDIATRPDTWVDGQDGLSWWRFFGNWSAEKMRFISINLGFTDYDATYFGTSTARLESYARRMYRLWREWVAKNGPMKDENDDEIVFPDRWAN